MQETAQVIAQFWKMISVAEDEIALTDKMLSMIEVFVMLNATDSCITISWMITAF